MFNNEKMWLNEFLHASIEVLWSRLRVGGYIVFQSVRYDYIGEYMLNEHVNKKQDGVFKGIISRVTTSGRYKPNWIWQKVNPAEFEKPEFKDVVEKVETKEEGKKQEEKEEKEEQEEQFESEQGEKKLPKKKVIFVKRKTLKKTPPSPP